jgi:hypothetical protein
MNTNAETVKACISACFEGRGTHLPVKALMNAAHDDTMLPLFSASTARRQPTRCTRQCAIWHAFPQYRVSVHTAQRLLPPPSQPGLAQHSRASMYAICSAIAPAFLRYVIAVLPVADTAHTFAHLWTSFLIRVSLFTRAACISIVDPSSSLD